MRLEFRLATEPSGAQSAQGASPGGADGFAGPVHDVPTAARLLEHFGRDDVPEDALAAGRSAIVGAFKRRAPQASSGAE